MTPSESVMDLHRQLGLSAPKHVSQAAFEGNADHLHKLARLLPDDQPNVRDLWEYTQDLLYTDIQTPLFQFLLPFCLRLWRDDLLGNNPGAGGFVEQFYPVLANREVFSKHLTREQTAAVSEFMRASIFEEIRQQRGLSYEGSHVRPYRWTGALTTYGVLLPDLNRLWSTWWDVSNIGSAVAIVQYVSCLMYQDHENPVFAPWTAGRGGGPPCLWQYEGHLYTHHWLEENVDFLKRLLNPERVGGVLAKAIAKLGGEPEYAAAAEVLADLPLCEHTLATRCAELPRILETRTQPGVLPHWPE